MASVERATEVDDLLTADEVARLLGVTPERVHSRSRQHRIPTVRLGRYVRYRRRAILEWVAGLEDGEH